MAGKDAPLTRREFIRKSSQLTAVGAASSLLTSCGAETDNPLEPAAIAHTRLASAVGGPYQITITGPTAVLRAGQAATIVGTIKDSAGKALANTVLGVSDGLRLFSTTTKTNGSGKISYATVVNATGVAVIEFVLNGYRYPFVFQSRKAQSPYFATSALFSSIAIKNATSRTLTARVTDSDGRKYNYSIPKNTTKSVVTVKKSAPKRITAYGGVTTGAGIGLAGASASLTVDTKGVATASVTGGAAILIRGSLYATSNGDIGACWAPGGNVGVTPVEISGEVAVCAGTDGVSIGAGGSLGGAAAGFSIDVF